MGNSARWTESVTVREVPQARLSAMAWLVLVLVIAGLAAWEWKMRSLGLLAGDFNDGKQAWAVERRKLEAGGDDGVVIVGGSRILFDTDLDVWTEMTGKRPVQLAMPGWNGQPVLKDIADNTNFHGLVVFDVAPTQLFREGGGGNPVFAGVLDYWREEGPAQRASHRLARFLERHFAFMDRMYSLTLLIDQLDLPNRGKINGPFLSPWKLSENYDDRQAVLWREIETNERLRQHAIRVWLSTQRPPPGEALIARTCADVAASVAKIRARGGDVVFIRPPSTGEYLAREDRATPRAATWDRLLRESGSFGIHFQDYPDMRSLNLPEQSHLAREDADRFTRAYVGVLRERYVGLRPGAVLHPRR
jgi:hypothetical protein